MKANGKFKLIAGLTIVAMLLTMSMSAFAASVTYGDFDAAEVAAVGDVPAYYDVTVTYNASDYASGDQVTLLVLKGSATIAFDTIDTTKPVNVAYIDQKTIPALTGDETAKVDEFTFKVDKSFFEKENGGLDNVYVKLGATSQETAAANTDTITLPGGGSSSGGTPVVDPVIEVQKDSENNELADAFGATGLNIVKVTSVPETTKKVKINGTEAFYTNYGGVVKWIALIKDFDASTATVETFNEAPTQLIYGNAATESSAVDLADIMKIIDIALLSDYSTQPAYTQLASDVTADGGIDLADIMEVIDIALSPTKVPTAATK